MNRNRKDSLGPFFFESLHSFSRINEESNPSLPWGGGLKNLFNRIYNLSELHFRPTARGFDGSMMLNLGTQLKEKTPLNLQATLIDPAGCEGKYSTNKFPGEPKEFFCSYESLDYL